MTVDEAQPESESCPRVLARPQGQLHDFPIEVRWEVSRRHPYYIAFWEDALKFRRETTADTPAPTTFLRYAASLMLGAIGVTGEPLSPDTDFKALSGELKDPAFLTGAVQPITLRAMVSTLLGTLPPAELREVGSLLLQAVRDEFAVTGDDGDRRLQKRNALANLAGLISPVLDSCPEAPLFYVHLGASQRSILRDMEDQVRLWKDRRGLGSSKVHTANLSEYLRVWDLREGWTGGGYDRTKELTFVELGRQLKGGTISTVFNRYRSAFRMITGHEFHPELWWRLLGPLKMSELLGGPAKTIPPVIHLLRSPARSPVPDSAISPRSDRAHSLGIVAGLAAIDNDIDRVDMLMDLRELIARNDSDEEIAKKLDLKDAEMVSYFRSREADFNSL